MEDFIESMMHEYMPGTYALKLELKNLGDILGNYVDLNNILKNIMKDIIEPSFISDISQLQYVELILGTELQEKPHYQKKEQIICMIDGSARFKMVPHVFRQEVYTGKNISDSPYYDGDDTNPGNKDDIHNTSPVNFLDPDV